MAVPRVNIISEEAQERTSNRSSVVSTDSGDQIRRFPPTSPFPSEALLSPPSSTHSSHPSPSGVDVALPDLLRDERSETPASTSSATLTAGRDSPSNAGGHVVLDVGMTKEPGTISDNPGPRLAPHLDDLMIVPGVVEDTHTRRYDVAKCELPKADYDVIPRCNAIPRRTPPTGNWQAYMHPEGNTYFRSEEFYTYAWAYDEVVQQYLNKAVAFLREEKPCHYDVDWDNVEICLELFPANEENPPYISFYLCDMAKREVFTLSGMSYETFLGSMSVVKVKSREHLDLAVESLYWKHIFMFPHGRKFSKETVRRLSAEIHWYMLNSKELQQASTARYSVDDLRLFLEIIKDIDLDPDQDMFPEDVAVIGRLKSFLVGDHFTSLHGEPCAQLDSARRMNQQVHTLRWWFTLWDWLFFLLPFTYFDKLRKVWVDEKINNQLWRQVIDELQNDWAASITPTTVILATSISFLAIQTVDQGGVASPQRSAAQILCYISTLSSIGNIVACTVLARRYRPFLWVHGELNDAEYLSARAVTSGHMQFLAIIYSIPTAFFLWALLTFTIAVLWVCLDATDVWTRAPVSLTLIICVILLVAILRKQNWQPFAMTAFKARMQQRLKRIGMNIRISDNPRK